MCGQTFIQTIPITVCCFTIPFCKDNLKWHNHSLKYRNGASFGASLRITLSLLAEPYHLFVYLCVCVRKRAGPMELDGASWDNQRQTGLC